MSLGASKPWRDVMEFMTGQREMDAAPMIEYFKPLMDWLKEENEKNNVKIGWTVKDHGHYCESSAIQIGLNYIPSIIGLLNVLHTLLI